MMIGVGLDISCTAYKLAIILFVLHFLRHNPSVSIYPPGKAALQPLLSYKAVELASLDIAIRTNIR